MDMSQYLDLFIDESKEHLQAINERLLELEKTPEDMSVVNDIFRSAHTLKGMSATMGFRRFGQFDAPNGKRARWHPQSAAFRYPGIA